MKVALATQMCLDVGFTCMVGQKAAYLVMMVIYNILVNALNDINKRHAITSIFSVVEVSKSSSSLKLSCFNSDKYPAIVFVNPSTFFSSLFKRDSKYESVKEERRSTPPHILRQRFLYLTPERGIKVMQRSYQNTI